MTNEFLKRMVKEKAVQLVQPSEEMKEANLRKSNSHLHSARVLFENGLFEESVSMSYYSMYHSVMALFFATGIKCENHSATILLLSGVFDFDSRQLSRAKKERIDKQYYASSAPARSDAEALLRVAEVFDSSLLDRIDRLTRDQIEQYRAKFLKSVL